MKDETEQFRREQVARNNSQVESNNPDHERIRLQEMYGEHNVWNTDELGEKFDVVAFLAPFVSVVRKSDGAKGLIEFQHSPRFYFKFTPTK